jgi:hypothetical protein
MSIEKEAKTAARTVLQTVSGWLFEIKGSLGDELRDESLTLGESACFLTELGFAIGPLPKKSRGGTHMRKINFKDVSARARAARAKHLAIALRVHELREARANSLR